MSGKQVEKGIRDYDRVRL